MYSQLESKVSDPEQVLNDCFYYVGPKNLVVLGYRELFGYKFITQSPQYGFQLHR